MREYLPLLQLRSILKAFEEYAAADTIRSARLHSDNAEADLGFTRLAAEPWSRLEDISIDYAVMERAPNLSVRPTAGPGLTWGIGKLFGAREKLDSDGVVTSGPSTALDCKNTLLQATSETQELVAMGLEDIIAVAMPDAVLVAHKDRARM